MDTIAFLHAHPDDESIFTGGTLALLAERGVRTVVVLATGDAVRIAEAHAACRELGVAVLRPLGYSDSGVHLGSVGGEVFASCNVDDAAERLAGILREEAVTALVTYDRGGIYSHPDHLAVHRVGHAAAVRAGVSSVYEATVDREYLHFVETHLVGEAVSWLAGEEHLAALNRAPLGVPTVEVTKTVDVSALAARKRAAILAHHSQIPLDSRVRAMDDEAFLAVYGYEWFIRCTGTSAIDLL